jgi:hypothetical protein
LEVEVAGLWENLGAVSAGVGTGGGRCGNEWRAVVVVEVGFPLTDIAKSCFIQVSCPVHASIHQFISNFIITNLCNLSICHELLNTLKAIHI